MTVDESWIHHYTPKTKILSKKWPSRGELDSKKTKTTPSATKVMATVFWDSEGIIFINYFQHGKIITGQYSASLLDRLND